MGDFNGFDGQCGVGVLQKTTMIFFPVAAHDPHGLIEGEDSTSCISCFHLIEEGGILMLLFLAIGLVIWTASRRDQDFARITLAGKEVRDVILI